MPNAKEPNEELTWQRRLATQANNHAWALTEQLQRTADASEMMIQAAHAASYWWHIVGDDRQKAHADQLLAHAYALAGIQGPAQRYGARALAFFTTTASAPWELALAHAVAANVAACTGNTRAHRAHLATARQRVDALLDPEDKRILEATMRGIPAP
jgi:hypothetical protein